MILQAYRRGFSIQSDYFRQNAPYVAMAASMGLLSTKVAGKWFSSEWRPTVRGLKWLEETFGETVEAEEDLDEGHE